MSRHRIRTIKPGNWHDEAVCAVSIPARLLRDVLITYADDDGRWRHQPRAIIGFGYPEDDEVTPAKVSRWTAELEGVGLIHIYQGENGNAASHPFGCFPKWHDHQVINHYRESELPAPTSVTCSTRTTGTK